MYTMSTFLLFSLLLLTITSHSSALYCICKDGVSDQQLQKNIDYACGAGADCTQISQNGPCYNPNTIKDHCNYAVNSYYQRKGAAGASCDFTGTATTTPNPPPTANSGCVYQSSPGNTGGGGTTTPTIAPPGTTTPTIAPPGTTTPTIAPPGTTTPTIAPPGSTIPTPAPPGTTTPGMGTGTGIVTTPGTNNPPFGPGPSGIGLDGNATRNFQNSIFFTLVFLAISFLCSRV